MHIIETLSATTTGANEVHVIVVMMAMFASAFAKCISGSAIGTWYGMNDSFIAKSLQGSVNGYTVHFVQAMFYIAMAQCTGILLQKQIEY
jgi:hypothetical protein